MSNKLDIIINQKQKEVADLKAKLALELQHEINLLLLGKKQHVPMHDFSQALAKPALSVIAEIKRKSPSKGHLAAIADPIALANTYIDGGADVLSILTDTEFFSGHLNDLITVKQNLSKATPILRKDFTIDEVQIAEAIYAGASAILLIVAALGIKTKVLLQRAHELGIEALVEVHNQAELEMAVDFDAKIIGINNRDLTTFKIDTDQAFRLVETLPKNVIKIAESGILNPELAQEYYKAGFDGVLIGEALVTAANPKEFIRACKNEVSY
jgi:indole-3-glycerol phosphate synthase